MVFNKIEFNCDHKDCHERYTVVFKMGSIVSKEEFVLKMCAHFKMLVNDVWLRDWAFIDGKVFCHYHREQVYEARRATDKSPQ